MTFMRLPPGSGHEQGPRSISANVKLLAAEKPAKRARSCSPRRSRGTGVSTFPKQGNESGLAAGGSSGGDGRFA